MAKIDGPINQPVAALMRGKADFYYWRGLTCVRSWPHMPPGSRTDGSREASRKMAQAMAWGTEQPTAWRKPWQSVVTPYGRTYQDLINTILLRLTFAGYTSDLPTMLSFGVVEHTDTTTFQLKHVPSGPLAYATIGWHVLVSDQDPGPQRYVYQAPKWERTGKRIPAFSWDWSQYTDPLATHYVPATQTWDVLAQGKGPFRRAVPYYLIPRLKNLPLSVTWTRDD